MISVVIPTLNEARAPPGLLAALRDNTSKIAWFGA